MLIPRFKCVVAVLAIATTALCSTALSAAAENAPTTSKPALPAYEIIPTGRPSKESGDIYSAFKIDRKSNSLWSCIFQASRPDEGVCRKLSGKQPPALSKSAVSFLITPSSSRGSDYWLVDVTSGAVSICGSGASGGGEADCVALKDVP